MHLAILLGLPVGGMCKTALLLPGHRTFNHSTPCGFFWDGRPSHPCLAPLTLALVFSRCPRLPFSTGTNSRSDGSPKAISYKAKNNVTAAAHRWTKREMHPSHLAQLDHVGLPSVPSSGFTGWLTR